MTERMTCHKCKATDYFDRDALKDSGGLLYCDRHDSFMYWTDSVPWHAGEPHTYFAELPGYKLVQPKHVNPDAAMLALWNAVSQEVPA